MKRTWLSCALGALLWQAGPSPAQVIETVPGQTPSTIVSTVTGQTPVVIESTPYVENSGGNNGRRQTGFYVGGGFYYLTPRWGDARAFDIQTTFTPTGAANASTVSTSTTFLDHDADFAPKVVLGYTGETGFGIRGSWWQLRSSAEQSATLPANGATGGTTTYLIVLPGINRAADDVTLGGGGTNNANQGVLSIASAAGISTPIVISSRLELDVVDLEATQLFQSGPWNLLITGGARYARLDQSYSAIANSPANPGVTGPISRSMQLSNVFEGVGPQLSLEVLRRLGWGFSIYGNGRAGVLFGQRRLSSTINIQDPQNAGGPINTTFTQARSDQDTLPYVEFEGGLQYMTNWGSTSPFLRAGVVGQNWFNAGTPSSNAQTRGGDLGLFGFQLSAGLNF